MKWIIYRIGRICICYVLRRMPEMLPVFVRSMLEYARIHLPVKDVESLDREWMQFKGIPDPQVEINALQHQVGTLKADNKMLADEVKGLEVELTTYRENS